MTELFPDISEETRARVEFIVELALRQKNLLSAVRVIKEYVDTCETEEEKDFVDFYFNLKMEQLLNEG